MRGIIRVLGYGALVQSLLLHLTLLAAWVSGYHGSWIVTFHSGGTGWQIVSQLGGIRYMQYDGIQPTTQKTDANGVYIPTIDNCWDQPFIRYARFASYMPGTVEALRREPMWQSARAARGGIIVTAIRLAIWSLVVLTSLPVVVWLAFRLRRRARRRPSDPAP